MNNADVMSENETQAVAEDIAIIAMSGRFPGASNIAAFWNNLKNGVSTVSRFTDDELTAAGIPDLLISNPAYVKARPTLENAAMFDAAFFGITPKDAEVMDPQHRIFLECSWEALEGAGYNSDIYGGSIGIFAGQSLNTYLLANLCDTRAKAEELVGAYQVGGYPTVLGNDKDYLTTRVSYKLNLRGPGVTVQTACSTSLVAVCQACQSLLNYQCDMALAGGVSISFPQERGYLYQEGGMVSPDGVCRAFDAGAEGTIFGAGAGVVLLKRLSEAVADSDTILAVIKGYALNNDGARKVSYMAPSVEGQAEVIAMAQAMAGVDAESISYIETHGTGTPLGDPIELAGLAQAFRATTDKTGFCAVGSVKTNTGHLEVAAGVTGLIKTVLALQNKTLPPSLNFVRPNPRFDFANSPFYVNDTLTEWKTTHYPRRAGVSAFGVGGTNAHLVLEEAPMLEIAEEPERWQTLILSAKSETALNTMTRNLVQHLRENPDLSLADAAYTLQTGRRAFSHRRSIVCRDREDAIRALEAQDKKRICNQFQEADGKPVAFLFPGQGAQAADMTAELYAGEPDFRRQIDICADLLMPEIGLDLRTVLYPKAEERDAAAELLNQTRITQPALFTVEYALAKWWQARGVQPAAMLGHSVGEYVAACLAGVFTLADGLKLLAARGRLIQQLPGGAMLAVRRSEAEIQPYLGSEVSLAAVNSPASCVLSGTFAAIEAAQEKLTADAIASRLLKTSHAFHSAMLDPVLEEFAALVRATPLHAPTIPYVSNVSGDWITAEEATDSNYWVRHLREAVRFADSVKLLLEKPDMILLEIGPGRTLTTLSKQQGIALAENRVIASLSGDSCSESEIAGLVEAQGRLWLAGAITDWQPFYANETRRRIALPTYPFERKRFWREPVRSSETKHSTNGNGSKLPAESVLQFRPIQPIINQPIQNEYAQANSDAENGKKISEWNTSMDAMQKPAENIAVENNRAERIAARLQNIMQEASGVSLEGCDASASFLELGFDSLFLTQASLLFQKGFGVKVTFRQLMGDLSSLAELSRYVDANLPPEALPASVPTFALSANPVPETAAPEARSGNSYAELIPVSVPVTQNAAPQSSLETIVQQQLQLMALQIEMLRSGNSLTTPAENQAPVSVSPVPQVQETSAKLDTTPVISKTFTPYKPINKARTGGLTAAQQYYLDDFIGRYNQKTAESKRLAQSHRAHHADSRAVSGFRAEWKEIVYPITVERSSGSKLWDADGNEYVDMLNGFGVTLFGHSPQFVTDAVTAQLQKGVEIGPQTPLAGKAAALVCELTGMERACFCSTGSEAVLAAIRLARTVTGRDKIVLFSGSYHGGFDEVLVRANFKPGQKTALPVAPGIPAANVENVYVLEYGSPEALEFIEANANELAAVLIETVQSRHPDLQPKAFVKEVRRITSASGTALILDEVVTGFRVHPGGAQAIFDVRADMTTYGKVVGGGFPIGVLAGRGDYMDALDGGQWQFGDDSFPEIGVTFQAGTFQRHPLAMAAAWAVLNHLKASGPALQERINAKAAKFVSSLNACFAELNVPTQAQHFGSILYFSFLGELRYSSLFYYGLRLRGVHLYEGFPCFLTTAHTDNDLDFVLRAFRETAEELQKAGLLPGGKTNNDSGVRENPEPVTALRVPLTEAQKEIWLSVQKGEDASCSYNESCSLLFKGELNKAALDSAIQQLIGRHDALRSVFSPDGECQGFTPKVSLDVTLTDFSPLSAAEREKQTGDFVEADASRPFDLIHGPVVRFNLLKLAPNGYQLIFTAHHIVCDGWSIGVLLDELSKLYSAEIQGKKAELETAAQFADFARAIEKERNSPETKTAADYWQSRFAAPVSPLDLPTDRPRPPLKSFRGSMARDVIDRDLLAQIKRVSAQNGNTLFSTLLAGFNALLYRLSGQNDLVVGIPAAAQSFMGTPDLAGHCLNFLPIRSRVEADCSFAEYAKEIKSFVLDAYDNQTYTFGTLVRDLNLPGDAGRLPLLSVMFNIDPGGMDELQFAGLECSVVNNPKCFTNMDLFLNIRATKGELLLECDYNTDLFDRETVQNWLGHYRTLLESIVSDASQPLDALALLTASRRQSLLAHGNDTQSDYDADFCLPQRIEAQAAKTPDAIALTFGGQTLTYRQVNQQANQIANYLRGRGVTADTCVGLCLDRTPALVVAALGVLKAGGAYVPLDPAYPKERLAYMSENAALALLITEIDLQISAGLQSVPSLCLTRDAAVLEAQSIENPAPLDASGNSAPPANADSLAYVLYTSGSTGKPKGVQIPHKALTNFLCSMQKRPGLCASDTLAAVTTLSFDIAGLELWLPLMTGAKIVLVSNEERTDGHRLAELLQRENVTVMQATPATWRLLIEAGWGGKADLKILCGGEALPADLAKSLLSRCASLWNMYGPTETTIWSAVDEVKENAPISLGFPIANTQVYVLDRRMEPVPLGAAGELYIGGDGLARGYVRLAEQTAARFVADPFRQSDPADVTSAVFASGRTLGGTPHSEARSVPRLYRTGDLARYRSDGSLEYLGRLDAQVKVRGFRIELNEIEAALMQCPLVRGAAVMAHDDKSGEKQLVAYVVLKAAETDSASNFVIGNISRFLDDKLPGYMKPAGFVTLDALPLTSNSKLDRKALKAPEGLETAAAREYAAPQTEEERCLAGIWAEVLNINRAGIHDDLFDLGGSSLHVLQIAARAQKAGIAVTTSQIFANRTISGLLQVLAENETNTDIIPVFQVPTLTRTERKLIRRSEVHSETADAIA